jgi:hypothetical protein
MMAEQRLTDAEALGQLDAAHRAFTRDDIDDLNALGVGERLEHFGARYIPAHIVWFSHRLSQCNNATAM